MACDRVLVMSDGRVAEIGRPTDLLRQPDSLFAVMARGDPSAALLLAASEKDTTTPTAPPTRGAYSVSII